jgi:hypothetical protein
MLNIDIILKTNGKIIDLKFKQYFKKKNIAAINDLLCFINNYSYPNWETIISSADIKNQISLYLFSRYTMELLSFYINIQKCETLKDIINENDFLNDTIKLYVINKKYSNIKKDAVNLLKTVFSKNKQLDKTIQEYFFQRNDIKI